MRVDAPALVFLSQTATDGLDGLGRAPWWAVMALALLGGTAGVAKVWSVVAEHLHDVREQQRRVAEEEKIRRDAKAKAEIEQIEALTSMARAMPKQFQAMGTQLNDVATRLADSNGLMIKQIEASARQTEANTKAIIELRGEMSSDTRALVLAIAGKLGVQSDEPGASGVRRLSSPDLTPKVQHA